MHNMCIIHVHKHVLFSQLIRVVQERNYRLFIVGRVSFYQKTPKTTTTKKKEEEKKPLRVGVRLTSLASCTSVLTSKHHRPLP